MGIAAGMIANGLSDADGDVDPPTNPAAGSSRLLAEAKPIE